MMAKRPVQTYTLKVRGRCVSRYLVYYHTFKMEIYNKHLTQILMVTRIMQCLVRHWLGCDFEQSFIHELLLLHARDVSEISLKSQIYMANTTFPRRNISSPFQWG